MHMNLSGDPLGGFTYIATAVAILGLVSTVFWMVVGWRAMRAHERVADYLRTLAERDRQSDR